MTTNTNKKKLWQLKRPHGRDIDPIAAVIRDRMMELDTNPFAVAKAIGMDYGNLFRFLTGQHSLLTERLPPLLDHLGLAITKKT